MIAFNFRVVCIIREGKLNCFKWCIRLAKISNHDQLAWSDQKNETHEEIELDSRYNKDYLYNLVYNLHAYPCLLVSTNHIFLAWRFAAYFLFLVLGLILREEFWQSLVFFFNFYKDGCIIEWSSEGQLLKLWGLYNSWLPWEKVEIHSIYGSKSFDSRHNQWTKCPFLANCKNWLIGIY
jgi:hypothetical protein